MRKLIKKIPGLVLWAAWLMLTAHSVIPHDHHSPEALGQSGESCPVSENRTEHHPVIPGHCHFLNDLTSEKSFCYSFTCNSRCLDFVPAGYLYKSTFELYLNSDKIGELPVHLQVSHFLELSLFRAPPVLG